MLAALTAGIIIYDCDHDSLPLTNGFLLVNPRHACTTRVTVLCLCVCVCVHSILLTRATYRTTRSADHRESFKIGDISKKHFVLKLWHFYNFLYFLSLGTLCLCVSVTTFLPTTLFSGAWRRFQIYIKTYTSFESYETFSL